MGITERYSNDEVDSEWMTNVCPLFNGKLFDNAVSIEQNGPDVDVN